MPPAQRRVLLGKIKRTVKKVVSSSAFLKLSASRKYSKKRTEDIGLDKLTIDKTKDLRKSGTKRSSKPDENQRDDLPRVMNDLSLGQNKPRDKGNSNPVYSRRIEFEPASSSMEFETNLDNNKIHGDNIALNRRSNHGENNNLRDKESSKPSSN